MRAWVSAGYGFFLGRESDSAEFADEALALEEAVSAAEEVADGLLAVGGEAEQVAVDGLVVAEVFVERIHLEGLAGVGLFLLEGVHVRVRAHEAAVLAGLELLVWVRAGYSA